MYSYTPYLESFSQLTPEEGHNITKYAQLAQSALEEGKGNDATTTGAPSRTTLACSLQPQLVQLAVLLRLHGGQQPDVFLATNFTQKLGSIVPLVSLTMHRRMMSSRTWRSFMRDGIAQVAKILNNGQGQYLHGTGRPDCGRHA